MTAGTRRVRYEKRGRVAYVTLDRPDVLNAMDLRMHEELADVWDDFAADDRLWVAVLSGAGSRAFSTGQDLKERVRDGGRPTTFGSRGQPGWPRLTERFELVKPVIACVQGYALGGGFELALACDLIIAGENAVFALPEARLGLVPGAGGVFRLVRQLPLKTAMATCSPAAVCPLPRHCTSVWSTRWWRRRNWTAPWPDGSTNCFAAAPWPPVPSNKRPCAPSTCHSPTRSARVTSGRSAGR